MWVSFFCFPDRTSRADARIAHREQLRRRMARARLAEVRIGVGSHREDVIQSRPRWSSIGLWTLFLLVQTTSSPQ